MTSTPAQLVDRLVAHVAPFGSAVVAFSAGVDSTVVLAVAQRALGDRALGLTGVSPSLAPAEARECEQLAHLVGARLEFAPTAEMDDPRYVANGNDRCFWCKSELYGVCARVAADGDYAVVLDGTNRDDVGDYRPGRRAADEAGVRSPLLECQLDKGDVRAVARHLGLPNWDKPAMACLASRLPHGTSVTAERLAAVDRVERALREHGFRQVRARHHGADVHLEVEPEHVARLTRLIDDRTLHDVLRAAGFERARVAADGYRRGRLNPTDTAATPGAPA